MNLFSLLDQAARHFPENPAVCVGTDCLLRYAELRSRASSLAAVLHRRYRTGDRIAIVSENRPEYVELLFGLWAAGLVAVPINAKLHPREVAQIVDDAQAAAVFVAPALVRRYKGALPVQDSGPQGFPSFRRFPGAVFAGGDIIDGPSEPPFREAP